MDKQKRNNWFVDFFKGGSLGTGILPGVSMGTVGIIIDIYDKMIDNIDGLRRKGHFKSSLLTLIPIFLGLAIFTILLMIFWNNVARYNFPFLMICILAGFIIGGFPLMYREIRYKKPGINGILRLVVSFLFTAGIGIAAFIMCQHFLDDPEASTTIFLDLELAVYDPFSFPAVYIALFVMGFISAVASIVPGVSGAMIMFITGLYSPIISLLIDKDLSVIINFSYYFTGLWWSKVSGLIILIIGMLLGFVATSTLMKKALSAYRVATFQVVCGFVVGSLVSMFLNNDMCFVYYEFDGFNWQMVVGPIALIIVALLTHYGIKRAEARNRERALEIIEEEEKEVEEAD